MFGLSNYRRDKNMADRDKSELRKCRSKPTEKSKVANGKNSISRVESFTSGRGRLPGRLGGELLPGGLASGGLASGLLGASHFSRISEIFEDFTCETSATVSLRRMISKNNDNSRSSSSTTVLAAMVEAESAG
jgi:hypothetical protein